MTSEAATRPDTRSHLIGVLGLALAGGAIETAVLFVRKWNFPMSAISSDFVWSVQLAVLAAALAAFFPFAILGRWWPRVAPVAVFAGLALVFLDLVFLIPRLSQFAAALLAAGIAMQFTRLVVANPARWRSIGQRMAMASVMVVAVLGLAARQLADQELPERAAFAQGKPNVLIITLDTVRAASLSLYGHGRPTSPELARIGSQGAVFERAFATAPWTLPSHASLFTGRLPYELGVDYYAPLDRRYRTLAESLVAYGYLSAGFAANLGYVSRGTGLARGFERYDDYPRTPGQFVSNSTLLRKIGDNFTLRRWLENDEHLNRVTADDLNARFFGWVDQAQGRPFFAFLNYFDAHEPYLPPAPFDRKFGAGRRDGKHSPLHHAQWNPAWPSRELTPDQLREEQDAYDEAIAFLDSRIGLLFEGLATRGLLEHTLVVITSDHGEEFAEHRVLEHGYSMYRAGLHVPLIVRLPGTVPATRVRTPVSLVDVAATILELVMGAAPPDIPGRSLAPHWVDPGAEGSPVVSTLTRPPGHLPDWYPIAKGDMHSVIWRGLHWILNGDGTEELYDLDADPAERENLAGRPEYGGLLKEMRAHLEAARQGRR